MDAEHVLNDLRRKKIPRIDLFALRGPGVYALFAAGKNILGEFPNGPEEVIYVGQSTNLASRQFDTHFDSTGTGFSTVRRSLGAILKQQLDLKAIPRGTERGQRGLQNYRFEEDGEQRLTDWMNRNLHVSVFSYEEDLDKLENDLIASARPILNLTKWRNPYSRSIKELRRICAREAKEAATR